MPCRRPAGLRRRTALARGRRSPPTATGRRAGSSTTRRPTLAAGPGHPGRERRHRQSRGDRPARARGPGRGPGASAGGSPGRLRPRCRPGGSTSGARAATASGASSTPRMRPGTRSSRPWPAGSTEPRGSPGGPAGSAVDLLTLSHHTEEPADRYAPLTCFGAYVLDTASGEVGAVVAKKTILATGGLGQIFLHTHQCAGQRRATGSPWPTGWAPASSTSNTSSSTRPSFSRRTRRGS